MATKEQLRELREDTIINVESKKQESNCLNSLEKLKLYIKENYNFSLEWEKEIKLNDIIDKIKKSYDLDFDSVLSTSSMKPDGGVLYMVINDVRYPILITEVKKQGTNDDRKKEGKTKQAKGNAIERLGKNVIGLRSWFFGEDIFPFICFGYGCDFAEGSSILDRVKTISIFGKLNEICVNNVGPYGIGNRGSFFFREEEWSEDEMYNVMKDIVKISIAYYNKKYNLNI